MKYIQHILLEYNNCGPSVYKIMSNEVITIDKVAKYFTETESWNEDRDVITFVDEPSELTI